MKIDWSVFVYSHLYISKGEFGANAGLVGRKGSQKAVAGLGDSDDVACTKTKAYRNIATTKVKDKRRLLRL
jgi:hypothetical protein